MPMSRKPVSSTISQLNRKRFDDYDTIRDNNEDVQQNSVTDNEKQEMKQILIDTDAGTDDAWGLFMLLQGHQDPNVPIKIEGITCVMGNTTVDNVTVNVTRTLKTVNERNIPVFRGAESALTIGFYEDPPYHGYDGFGDAFLPPIVPIIENENAVQAIIRLLDEYREKLTIIALGPLTNLALAIKLKPVIHNFPKEILILGGNIEGYGNVSTSAEFNFMCDVEAARTVLESYTCPITIVPAETWEKFATSTHGFRLNILGNIKSNKIDLLNKIEAKNLEKYKNGWSTPDAVAAAVFMNPSVVTKKENFYCTVELQGSFTRGMMVVDRKSHLENLPNVTLISGINLGIYEQMLMKTAAD